MGLFDSVYADCPRCGRSTEFQTKADIAPYMNSYTLENAPDHLLTDVLNEPNWCAGCKTWFVLIAPEFPPGPPPRPTVSVRPVREPTEGEFDVYRHNPDELRWWRAPFSYADLATTPEQHREDTSHDR